MTWNKIFWLFKLNLYDFSVNNDIKKTKIRYFSLNIWCIMVIMNDLGCKKTETGFFFRKKLSKLQFKDYEKTLWRNINSSLEIKQKSGTRNICRRKKSNTFTSLWFFQTSETNFEMLIHILAKRIGLFQ